MIVDRTLPGSQAVVAPRLLTVLRGYAERDDVLLSVGLSIARAALSVPVRLQLLDGATATTFPLRISAGGRASWFPAFHGVVRCDDLGVLASRLRLSGELDVPLGVIGTMVNRRILGFAAQRSLRGFVGRLRSDVLDEVRRSELDVRLHQGLRA